MLQLVVIVVSFLSIAGVWTGALLADWPLWIPILSTVVIIVADLGSWLARRFLAIQRSRRIEQQLYAQAEQQRSAAGAEERTAIDEMRQHFQENFQALRQSSGGAGALAELPWYLVIGLPGSGKTTLIRESGLTFPSTNQPSRAVRGIGGTRDCDWWLTDQAVFLDTAGRYANEESDRDEWLAFLDLLRQQRRGEPINGIVVTSALPDLIGKDRQHIEDHARQLRQRIEEVCRRLQIVAPVYVVYTKGDKISGFKDFVRGLPDEQRERFLGRVLPWEGQAIAGETALQQGLARVAGWVQRRRLLVFDADGDGEQRKKVFRFPSQLRAVGDWMGQFLDSVVVPAVAGSGPRLRAFFITSAVIPGEQAPQPAEANSSSGDSAAPVAGNSFEGSIFIAPNAQQQQQGRPQGPQVASLFVRHLFRQVLIPDRALVQLSPAALRRRRLVRLASIYGSAGLTLLLVILVSAASWRDLSTIDEVRQQMQVVRDVARQSPDNAEVNLDALQELHRSLVDLDKNDRLDELLGHAAGVYGDRLRRLALMPIAARIAEELTALLRSESKDRLEVDHMQELVQVYRMLAGDDAVDADLVSRKLSQDGHWREPFQTAFGELSQREQDLVEEQCDGFLTIVEHTDSWQVQVDRPLIEQVEQDLSEKLWVQLAYEDLIDTGNALAGGDAVALLPGGRNLLHIPAETMVPPVFTRARWERFVKPAITDKSRALAERYERIGKERSADDLAERLLQRYRTDFRLHWIACVKSARPNLFGSLKEAQSRLFILSGKDSPYRELVQQFMESNRLVDDSAIEAGQDLSWLDEGLQVLSSFDQSLLDFVNNTQPGRRYADVGRLRSLAMAFDGSDRQLLQLQSSAASDERRQAVYFSLRQVLEAVRGKLVEECSEDIDRQWRLVVVKPWQEQFAEVYPFAIEADDEVLLATYAKFFNPVNGTFWQMVEEIRPLEEVRVLDRNLLPLSRIYRQAVARAEQMVAALFPQQSPTVAAPLVLQIQQREAVWDVHMHVSGKSLRLKDLPKARMHFTWQQADPLGAKIVIFIKDDKQLKRDEFADQQWGLLRLLRAADRQFLEDGTVRASWSFDGKQVGQVGTYQASAVIESPEFNNLLADGFWSGFVCPVSVTDESVTDER